MAGWRCSTAKPLRSSPAFGTLGSEPGQFTNLHHIAADSKGNIYTAEVGQNRRVQKFVDARGLD